MQRRHGVVLAAAMAQIVLALAAPGCVPTPAEPAPSGSGLTLAASAPEVAALGQESQASLTRSRVPMYVLPSEYAQGTLVMDGEQWSALSFHDDQLTISLHATGTWHDQVTDDELATIGEPNARVGTHQAWMTINEGIRALSWNEGDVAYVLDVECSQPEQDVRCTEGAFLTALAARLVPAHVGGAR